MQIDTNKGSIDPQTIQIIDLDTGLDIARTLPIVYADDDLGIYEVALQDEDGFFFVDPENPEQLAKERRRGRIKILLPAETPTPPSCPRCGEAMHFWNPPHWRCVACGNVKDVCRVPAPVGETRYYRDSMSMIRSYKVQKP
jgi:hypothetical protein